MIEEKDNKAYNDDAFDQLMRQSIAGHRSEPRPGLWKGISRKLLWNELLHFNFTNLSLKYWAAGTAALLVVASSLYFGLSYAPTDEESAIAMESADQDISQAASTSPVNAPGMSAGVEVNPVSAEDQMSQTTKIVPGEKGHNQKGKTQPEPIAFAGYGKSTETLLMETAGLPEEVGTPDIVFSPEQSAVTENSGIIYVKPYSALLPVLSGTADTIIILHNSAGISRIVKTGPETTSFFSASVGVTPEVSIYNEPDDYSKANVWLNGNITYNVSRFSVTSGFGIGYVYDLGKYQVEYKSLDSIGYYTAITSYSVGTNNQIEYTTKLIGVYDSLYHEADYRTTNRYTYLQVPLLLGYRLFETGKLSLTFRTGPAVSFLLATRNSDPVIEYSNATIIRLDDETPSRVQTNWQLWADLYFEMRMNKQVSLYLDPSFKYFFQPMVEQENVTYKAPMTIGLGVGIQFNFGQKQTSP